MAISRVNTRVLQSDLVKDLRAKGGGGLLVEAARRGHAYVRIGGQTYEVVTSGSVARADGEAPGTE